MKVAIEFFKARALQAAIVGFIGLGIAFTAADLATQSFVNPVAKITAAMEK